MTTKEEVIENPICIKCGKQTKEPIYISQKDSYVCIKCGNKEIDTNELLAKYTSVRIKILQLFGKVNRTMIKYQESLVKFGKKTNEQNRKILQDRLERITKIRLDIADSIKRNIPDSTLIAKDK